MHEAQVVLLKIAAMLLVMAVGFVARRRGILSLASTRAISVLVVDVALPSLIFEQMIATVDRASLANHWYVPLLAVATVLPAWLLGRLTAPVFVRDVAARPTYVFVAAISNWVYLPLPIAAALYGEQGKLIVLLYNVGGLTLLWTLGVWTLRGGRPDWRSVREVLRNPGLLATAAGIALALLIPGLRDARAAAAGSTSPALFVVAALLEATALCGTLTVPLSLVVIGAQLSLLPRASHATLRPTAGVLLTRLVLAPVASLGLFALAARLGTRIDEPTRFVTYLIAAMPVALNCGVLTERFLGDVPLASRAILYTTLVSVITVPGLLFVARALFL